MNQSIDFADRVQLAFRTTERGVVGLVGDLLGLCRLLQLRFNFSNGLCLVNGLGADAQEALDIPVPKSVFRAALARIAAICNEQHPQSVSPYKGKVNIALPPPVSSSTHQDVTPSTCHVSFANTPSDQHLEMRNRSFSASLISG